MHSENNAFVIKCCLLGQNGVGKSSLVRNFIDPDKLGVSDNLTGPSVATHSVELGEGKSVDVRFFYHRVAEKFVQPLSMMLRGASCAVVVYDANDRSTFEKLEGLLQEVRFCTPEHAVICIVGNKCEDASARKVSSEEGRLFALRHGALFFETSSLTGMNVQEMFLQTLSSALKNNVPVSVRRREPNAYCVQQ